MRKYAAWEYSSVRMEKFSRPEQQEVSSSVEVKNYKNSETDVKETTCKGPAKYTMAVEETNNWKSPLKNKHNEFPIE